MTKISKLVLTMLFTFTAAAWCADTVTLAMKAKKGDKIPVRMVADQDISMELQGQKIDMKQVMQMDYTNKILSVDAKGVASVEVTYTRVKFKQKNQFMAVDYDSADKDKPVPPMAAGFAGLVDASFTFKMAPSGKVSDVKTDGLIAKMAKNLPDGPQKDLMIAELKKQFGSDKMAEQLALASDIYPEKPVAINDTWDKKAKISSPFTMKLDTSYTLKSKTKTEAKLVVSSKIDGDPDGPGMPGLQGAKVLMKGSQSGHIIVDRANGWPQYSEINQDVKGKLSMQNPQTAEAMDMPMQLKSKITITSGERLKKLMAAEKKAAAEKTTE